LEQFIAKPNTLKSRNGKTKKRHGCLAAWLTVSIVFNIIFVVLYLTGAGVSESSKGSPTWAIRY